MSYRDISRWATIRELPYRYCIDISPYRLIPSISPDKARKGVIYPLKTGIYALVGISERTFTPYFFNKGVRYAHIKIPARTFHSFVSFAYNN